MSMSNRQNGTSQTSNSQVGHWQTSVRWQGISRPYPPDDVNRLRGSFHIEHTIARHGAERLWNLLHNESESYVPALGAMTGNQAIPQVKAGFRAISISRSHIAPAANRPRQTTPNPHPH